MGWVCPDCGSENSFKVKVCRACGHKVRPAHLVKEQLATIRDCLQANQFDFLGQSLEECAWDRAGQAVSVWRGILPYALTAEVIFTAIVMLLNGMPRLFNRLPVWQNTVAATYQIVLARGELAWESLLYDWRSEEERVQVTAGGLNAFAEDAAAWTEKLAQRAGEYWSASSEAVAALKPRLRAGFHLERVTDQIKEAGTLALGGWQGVERRAETWERAGECIAQYQESFTERIQESMEKVKSQLPSPENG